MPRRVSRLAPLVLLAAAPVWVRGAEPEFRPPFNGKDLTGWDAEPGLWRVKDGVIEGGYPGGGPIAHSSWLVLRDGDKDAVPRDFHFRCEFKTGEFNSGGQYRSTRLHPKRFDVGGYQMDFLNGPGTGGLYHQTHQGANVGVGESVANEKGGKGVVVGQVADCRWLFGKKYHEKSEWARVDVVCRGNHMAHFVNDYPMVEYVDRDEATPDRKRRDDGVIALQLHAGKGTDMRVSFRELSLKPVADRFGDAARVFNGADLDGWKVPAGEKAWAARAAERDKTGNVRAFGRLASDGTGKQPLVPAAEHGPAFLFRCQVKTDAWKPGEKAPFRGADGWNLLEVTLRDGRASVESNGEPRTDIPAPVAGGARAAGRCGAEYRNLVLIPILPAK